MSEEKKLILEMVKDGKITTEEALKLLETQHETEDELSTVKSTNKKFLRIIVNEGEKTKVNINIPIALAEVGLKLIPKDALNVSGNKINLDEILNLIKDGAEGEFVNVDTIDNGKEVKVKVFID
jgi:hypothetical protein